MFKSIIYPGPGRWAAWQKILFRFFFILVILYVEPWTFVNIIPGAYSVTQYYYQFQDWAVNAANSQFFHVREVLVPMNGSGDTSWAYAQLQLYLWIAFIGMIVWTILNRKAENYNALSYWIRLFTRYFLIINCFLYGIDKLLLLQMPFPSNSQLATPLGDLLPMRLSWMFMGYSSTYQFFSGLIEVIAGCLLLFRRTTTLGLFFSAGVFLNVAMLNLSYDIPVKLFSIELLVFSLFLLSFEAKRVFSFFFYIGNPEQINIYKAEFQKRWMRITKICLKLAFVVLAIVLPTMSELDRAKEMMTVVNNEQLPMGFYKVESCQCIKDSTVITQPDSLVWKDMIIDSYNSGSFNSKDTLFRQRYGRGYFNFNVFDEKKRIDFYISTMVEDSVHLFSMNYSLPDSNTVKLDGRIGENAMLLTLKRTKRHFQLTERQFHWLSEYNR